MPLLRLQVNVAIQASRKRALLAQLSAATARELGKPESYMMVTLEDQVAMMLGGSDEPLAFFEVRSIGGVSAAQARSLSNSISEIVEQSLEIPPLRIYSNYRGVDAAQWGHNGGTFG